MKLGRDRWPTFIPKQLSYSSLPTFVLTRHGPSMVISVYLHKDKVNGDNTWKNIFIYNYSIGQGESNIFHIIEHKIGTKKPVMY